MDNDFKPYTVSGGDFMSYNIRYNPDQNKKYPKSQKYKPIFVKQLAIAGLLIVFVYVSASKGWYKILLPGNPDVTASALSSFVEKIGEGKPVKEAVYSFCEEIIDSGDIE